MRPGVGGNRRAGWIVGGSLLIFLGLGLGIVLNLYLHLIAPVGGCIVVASDFHVCSSWGWYATVVVSLGAFATLVGAGMVWLASQVPRAPLRVFDSEGRFPPDPAEP